MNDTDQENRQSLFTVRNAKNAMIAFTVIAIAIAVLIFLHELLIDRIGIVKSLYAVADNVSNILSTATLLTIFEEGLDLMFFHRTREERAKLKEEKRHFEAIKKHELVHYAIKKMNEEDYSTANLVFSQVIEDNERNPVAHICRAFCKYELLVGLSAEDYQEQMREIVADLEKALALSKDLISDID